MQIWANTLVKNEERYLWFAVTSVINYLDKVLLWDTGSTDNTMRIIEELKKTYKQKIDFREVGNVKSEEFTLIRQQMLEQTKSDWVILVDGDEVWWDDSIKEIRKIIENSGKSLESVVNRYYNVIGDIFHYQEEKAGKYNIDGKEGHLTIRAMSMKIPGLHFDKPHGQQGVFDGENTPIQYRDPKKRIFLDKKMYLHFTHMIRSKNPEEDLKVMKRDIKFKYELGISFPLDFYYPEVFFRPRPDIVSSPWSRLSKEYYLKAVLQMPIRYLKRRMIRFKSGY